MRGLAVCLLLAACGGRSSRTGLECGPGTHAVDGACVPLDGGADSDSDSDGATDTSSSTESASGTDSDTASETDTSSETNSDSESEVECPSGEWIAELVSDAPGSPGWPSLALGSDGSAHVSYMFTRGADPGLHHAWREIEVWEDEYITEEAHGSEFPMLVDESSAVFGAFTVDTGLFAFSKPDGEALTTEEIDPTNGTNFVSLAMDASGTQHVAFVVNRGAGLRLSYANNADGSWSLEDLGPSQSAWTGIAVETSGVVHVVTSDLFGFVHVSNVDGDWVRESVELDVGLASIATIGVDSLDVVHVIYGGAGLRHASLSDGAWDLEDAVGTGWGMIPAPVVIGPDDSLHICFENHGYGRRDDAGWTEEDVAPDAGKHATYCSIAMDSEGAPWVAFQDMRDYDDATGDGGTLQLARRCP